MKFSGYQQQIQLNTINPPAVRAPGDLLAYGTGGKGSEAMAGAIGQINKVVTKQQDDMDAADVMDARNKIMTSLTEQLYNEDGLLTTGIGENAKGLTGRVTSAVHDTFEDISKDYNARVRYALQSNLNENMSNFQRIAATQEKNEYEKLQDANYKGNIDNNSQRAGFTWDVPNSLTHVLQDNYQIVTARAVSQGWSGQQLQQQLKNANTMAIGSAVESAIANEKYDRAEEILRYKRADMDQSAFNKYWSQVKQKNEVKKVYSDAESIAAQIFDPNTGKIDYNKMNSLLDDASYETTGGGITYSGNQEIDKYIDDAASENGVDPVLVAAVAKQESNFSPSAVSGVGAMGVMQLMPDTAAELGVADASNAQENIRGGAKYLGQLLKRYNGNMELALAAYNAGPSAVDKYKGVPPYEETQNYVKNVMENYEGYKAVAQDNGDTTPAYEVAGANLDNLNQTTKDKIAILDNWAAKSGYGHFAITSGNDGTHDDQKHYSGQAVDVVNDNFEDNDIRAAFIAKAKSLGLNVYDEYDRNNWTANTTGANIHLSDDGSAVKRAGNRVINIELRNRLKTAVEAKLRDKQQEFNQNKEMHKENVMKAIEGAGSYSAACEMIDSDTALNLAEKNQLKGMAASKYGKPSAGGGRLSRFSGAAGGGGASSAKIQSAYGSLEKMQVTMAAGKNISVDQFIAARRAGNLLDDSGALSDDEAQELRDAYSDQDFESTLTDSIETNGIVGAYNQLINSGMSATVATILISKIDPSYLNQDYQGDNTEEE